MPAFKYRAVVSDVTTALELRNPKIYGNEFFARDFSISKITYYTFLEESKKQKENEN
jgi:hypothetical protein